MKNHSFQWLLLCSLILFWGYLLCYLITLSNPAKCLCNLTPLQKELTCLDLPASLVLLPSFAEQVAPSFITFGLLFTAYLTPSLFLFLAHYIALHFLAECTFSCVASLGYASFLTVRPVLWCLLKKDTSSFPSLHMCLLITLFRETVYWLSLCLQLNTAKHLVFTVPPFYTTHPASSQLLQNRCPQITL